MAECKYWRVRYFTRRGECHGITEQGSYESVESKYESIVRENGNKDRDHWQNDDIVRVGSIHPSTESGYNNEPVGYSPFW